MAEEERRKIRKQEELNAFMTEPDSSHSRYPHNKESTTKKFDILAEGDLSDEEEEEQSGEKKDFIDNKEQAVGVKRDAKTRTTVRNLRIREDTAKYLRNLDPNSAYYDPKSRSMRENPTPDRDNLYFGDNFIRESGDKLKFNSVESYVWKEYEKGSEIHLQGAPSETELKFRKDREIEERTLKERSQDLTQRYGSQDQFKPPSKDLLFGQTEVMVEYAHDGTLLKGKNILIPQSKFAEDGKLISLTFLF